MICPRCKGNIKKYENCEKCGISYRQLIKTIRHDEMKKLFLKIDKKMQNREDITVEESLLAVELVNSSLLVPVKIEDDTLAVMNVEDENHKMFIPLFTDKEEYDRLIRDFDPSFNPFEEIVKLLEKPMTGFVINPGGIACGIGKKYIKKYFEKE